MTLTEHFVARRNEAVPGPWQVLAGADRTGGSVMFGEARLPGRTPGPGLHVHTREDEAVFIMSGVVTFVVGDRRFRAGAGELVWLPRELPHTFANLDDEPAWAFGTTTPAGLGACSRSRRITSRVSRDPQTPSEPQRSARGTASGPWDRHST